MFLILGDSYRNRRALSPVDSDQGESLLAETGPCDLLVHYEDYSSSWSEMTIQSDLSWDEFQTDLANNLEIPQRKFKESALVNWSRGGASARGKGIAISDAKRWTQILGHLKQAKEKQKNIDPTIPNIYIKVMNLKVCKVISHLTYLHILFYTARIP